MKSIKASDLFILCFLCLLTGFVGGGIVGSLAQTEELKHDRQTSYDIYLEAKENAFKEFKKAEAIYLEEYNEETN